MSVAEADEQKANPNYNVDKILSDKLPDVRAGLYAAALGI